MVNRLYSQLFYRKYDNHKHDNHKSDNRSIVRLSKQLSKKDYPIWIKAKASFTDLGVFTLELVVRNVQVNFSEKSLSFLLQNAIIVVY